MGAWIETAAEIQGGNTDLSLPMWERGLKLIMFQLIEPTNCRSPCGSEDGKKIKTKLNVYTLVAHKVGAWSETCHCSTSQSQMYVAPHVGAWIETNIFSRHESQYLVAPHVGAWIETYYPHAKVRQIMSLPMWERGLKRE